MAIMRVTFKKRQLYDNNNNSVCRRRNSLRRDNYRNDHTRAIANVARVTTTDDGIKKLINTTIYCTFVNQMATAYTYQRQPQVADTLVHWRRVIYHFQPSANKRIQPHSVTQVSSLFITLSSNNNAKSVVRVNDKVCSPTPNPNPIPITPTLTLTQPHNPKSITYPDNTNLISLSLTP